MYLSKKKIWNKIRSSMQKRNNHGSHAIVTKLTIIKKWKIQKKKIQENIDY